MRSTVQGLWKRRYLLGILVTSHLKRTSRNSALGLLWWFLDPLLMAGVYYVVVVVLFKRAGGHHQPYLLFLVCSLFAWKSFSDTASTAATVIQRHGPIIKSVSFPMAVLPFSLAISNTIYFVFSLAAAAGIASLYGPAYGTWPNAYYALLLIPTATQMILAAGAALFLGTLGLFFKDLQNIVRHVLRIGYYMSPGLYGIDAVPERFRDLYMLNPFAGLMTSYRDIIMYGRAPDAANMLVPLGMAVVVFLAGFVLFRRLEGRFVQYV